MAFAGPFGIVYVAYGPKRSIPATPSSMRTSDDCTSVPPATRSAGQKQLGAKASLLPPKLRNLFHRCGTTNIHSASVAQSSVASENAAPSSQPTTHSAHPSLIAQVHSHTNNRNKTNTTTAPSQSPTSVAVDSVMQSTSDGPKRHSICLSREASCGSKHLSDESNDSQSGVRSIAQKIKLKFRRSPNAVFGKMKWKLPWLSRRKHDKVVEALKKQLEQQPNSIDEPKVDDSDILIHPDGNPAKTSTTRNTGPGTRTTNDPKSGATSTSSEESPKYAVDRRDWAAIHAISDHNLQRIARVFVHTPSGRRPTLDQFRVTGRTEGTYHQIVFMELEAENQVQEFVVRIPAHGTEERWQRPDEDMLDDEAVLMRYIKHHTKVPLPKVLGSGCTVWNEIGAPFIIMEKLPGKQAYDLWYEDSEEDRPNGKPFFLLADQPSEATEAKRLTFLRSLAACMAELGKLQFRGIGIPHCNNFSLDDEPTIRPSYHWLSGTDMKAVTKRSPFSSSREFIQSVLDADWDVERELSKIDVPEEKTNAIELRGLRKLIEIIYSQPVFRSSPTFATEESFVLRHNDLDLQNILVDEEGNVTGIIDWDRCTAVPRCIGTGGAVPKFLNRDWHSESDIDRAPHMAFKLEHYRQVYYEALKAAGCKDAVYTRKSPMYQAAIFALYHDYGIMEDFLKTVLDEIPGVRGISLDNLAEGLGYGWPTTEEHLRREIEKLFRVDDLEDEDAKEKPEEGYAPDEPLQTLAERAHLAETMLAHSATERGDGIECSPAQHSWCVWFPSLSF
ncbi:uncharacterized protein EI97DRAFT_444969 [Westerdykella ornata]|uniref:Aminoglycoside phosphotransferase domain-containing protein n=1 Tax=Westerdykella ornata TaxID=318751 RepID=A0A6A6JAL9_WESOR|nr:uncharacterized protein EI97DRAFT_444969 [Westerdykella ornata]KAF2273452.1 hypothetical protein EI97DRAFT_444969 [Westerdykella ornata]